MSTMTNSQVAPQPAVQAAADPPLPNAVTHLQRSMKVLEAAALALSGRKSANSKTKENAKLLIAAGNRLTSAIVAACAHRPGDLQMLAKVHVVVARESMDEWTKIVHERGTSSTLASVKLRTDTASQVHMFALAMQALVEMLEIKNDIAQLVLDPARCIGLSEAKPSSDLPTLFTSLAIYEGFKVVVQGLANMTDGAPWPWKAIPQTILQFTSMVERAIDQPQKVRDLTDRIARRIAFLLGVSQNKGGSDTELDICVEDFLADVQRILIRLRIIEKVHPAKTFPLTDHIDNIIAGEAEKMRHSLQDLQPATEGPKLRFAVHTAYTVKTVAYGVAAIQEATDRTLAMTTDIASTVEPMAASVDITRVMVTEMYAAHDDGRQKAKVSNRARLPARPFCFKGRMAELSALVKLICESHGTRIAIMGPGGMGKTSLARAILHDDDVVSFVPDNRFFLSVENSIDIESAAKRLAEQLGVGETSDPQSAVISALEALSCSLLVIDNLNYVPYAAAQKDTERFLQPVWTWSNARAVGLVTLSLDAARDTFEQIAGHSQLATECQSLDELLAGVDCVPLAVTLLAQLGALSNAPSQLLQRGMAGGSEGRQLLSICAHLPDGLRPPIFAQLLTHFSDIHAARDLLVLFALVSVGSNDELRMLSPVRHFVLKDLPMTDGHLAALRDIYFAIAASGPVEPNENFSQLAKNVEPEYGNLTSFLLHLIETEEPSQELYDAVHRVSEYSYYTVPSVTLREAFRLRLTMHPAWLGRCLQNLGRTRVSRDEYSQAADKFQAARKLFTTLGDRLQEAGCRQLLGQCLQLQTSFEAAERELHAARDTFLDLDCEVYAARCAHELGIICQQRDENEQAIVHLTSARDTFKRHGKRSLAAQCTYVLGVIQSEQSNLPAAEFELRSAKFEFEAVSNLLGAAQCMETLGDVRILQEDYDSAEKLLFSAQKAYKQLDEKLGLANCLWSLGTLYRDQGRTLEALESFETARDIYESIGRRDWVGQSAIPAFLAETTSAIATVFAALLVSKPDPSTPHMVQTQQKYSALQQAGFSL
ncbi:hypothetical protein BKA62DRAFT_674677 [Auriculariales sp. MPI-PUGE-AT-0066]|nr:hypothetical protein BKA62DRAFT_674677 [Auriculariales sp. MPI-PUGE-AT-0066]